MVSQELQLIVDFVEGRVTPEALEQQLYYNPRLEEVLNNPASVIPGAVAKPDVFLYVVQRDFKRLDDTLDVHEALTRFLYSIGVDCTPTQQYWDLYEAILKAQPDWVGVDHEYIRCTLVPLAGDRTGEELVAWLRTEMLKMFKCFDQPPRWVENPEWPILDGRPMTFVGQINGPVTATKSADDLAFYVFVDDKTGRAEVIRQVS